MENENTILLPEFTWNALQTINQLLTMENYYVHRKTLAQYQTTELITPPKLIIFDLLNNKDEAVNATNTEIIAELTTQITSYFDQQQLPVPPLLAYTNVEARNKQQVFALGMLDYISHPPIKQELNYRVQQALSYDNNLSTDSNSCFEQSKPNQYALNQSQNSPLAKKTKDNQQQGIDPEFVLAEKTVNYLLNNLTSEIKLTELAREMAINRNKLAKAFKAYSGSTIFTWLFEQRMLHAAKLLLNTSQSIMQIAEQVGYQDSNNFSTAFKRAMGQSPRQYRQAVLAKVQQTKKEV